MALSRDGNRDIGKMSAAEKAFVVENLGMEIYVAMWNLCYLADLAGADLERASATKAEPDLSREW